MLFLLEDNLDKAETIMMKYRSLFSKQFSVWAQTVREAKLRLEALIKAADSPEKITFFLDNELADQSTGIEFFEWLLGAYPNTIGSVIIVTYSPNAVEQMVKMCQAHNIPYDKI